MTAPAYLHLEAEPASIQGDEMAGPWDANAATRLDELRTGDPAYADLANFMVGYINRELPGKKRIIDAGCGLGFLALALAQEGHEVVGIDPSEQSIKLAQAAHPTMPNLQFSNHTLEEYASAHPGETADIIVANMVLNSVSKLPSFMSAAADLLPDEGRLLATMAPMEYLYRKGVKSLQSGNPQVFRREFSIHGHEPHPEPVYFFYYPAGYVAMSANASRLVVADTFMIKDPLTRQPKDIRFWRFQPGEVKPW